VLRIFDIDAVPLEVHADELAGLVGMANIVHGRAPFLPFFDLRVQYLPLYGFLEYGSTRLFGDVPFAMRLPAVLFGVVSVAALRWLVLELVASVAVADTAAALFAVLPWAVHLARIAWEPAAVFPFLLGGLAALAAGLRLRSGRYVVFAGLLLGIGVYSYRAEAFDGALLAATLLLADRRRARALPGGLLAGAGVTVACVAPLAFAVFMHPHFFWRDEGIATFGHGVTPAAVATFVHNYAAHFALDSLFATGDGFLDHGPRYGVLYWWMLPFTLFGIAAAWHTVRRPSALLFYVWLLLYPLGGALTNDGVPDFPRTLIGAPLACIFTALGLRFTWRLWPPRDAAATRKRDFVAAAFGVIVAVSVLDFCRNYFFVYPAESADAFRYGTASLFKTVRGFEGSYERVCFDSLDWYNYETLTGYYLADSPLIAVEANLDACVAPRSLIVVSDPAKTLPNTRLLATQQNYEGRIIDYIYGT
jgi:4-amino-4-deoxy-L-arabinose transferase-like glycosyltransferase